MSYSQVRVITHNRAPVRYEVGQLLGMGGYGATFQATAINLLTGANNQVAIKFVFPSDTVSYSDAILEADNYAKVADIAVSAGITTISCQVNLVCFHTSDVITPNQATEYQHIFSLLQSVVSQPGALIQAKQLDPNKPIVYIVTDFLSGHSLGQLIRDYRQTGLVPTENELKRFLYDTLTGLNYLRNKGISHRDLKPENIIRTDSGRYVIIDFGLICSSRTCSTISTISTKYYTPSEQLVLQTSGYKIPFQLAIAGDIFALGKTLIEYGLSQRLLKLDNLAGIEIFKPTTIPLLDPVAYPTVETFVNEMLLDYNYIACDPDGYNRLLARLLV